jgi:hypothetical protein
LYSEIQTARCPPQFNSILHTSPEHGHMRRLILRSRQSPGDILMLTAAVRDLHAAHIGAFETDVRTSAEAIWDNNRRVTKLSESDRQVEVIDMHYPLVHESNQKPYHFVHGYAQYLEKKLGVSIPVTRFGGEIFLDKEERSSPLPGHELPDKFWIMMAGGKYDFTAKWWNPASYQRVVDHFQGQLQFVQCGEAGHWHPPLNGVTNLVGKTSLRQFIRLMHHSAGVVCPVTFAMHLAAAVETRPGMPKVRPCVVLGGGREPTHWEAYPQHQYISAVGALSCCLEGGCWKSRCQLVGDGDEKDRREVCEQPVQITPELRIPRCLDMITPEDVIRRIEMYLEGPHAKAVAVPIARILTVATQAAAVPAPPHVAPATPIAKSVPATVARTAAPRAGAVCAVATNGYTTAVASRPSTGRRDGHARTHRCRSQASNSAVFSKTSGVDSVPTWSGGCRTAHSRVTTSEALSPRMVDRAGRFARQAVRRPRALRRRLDPQFGDESTVRLPTGVFLGLGRMRRGPRRVAQHEADPLLAGNIPAGAEAGTVPLPDREKSGSRTAGARLSCQHLFRGTIVE